MIVVLAYEIEQETILVDVDASLSVLLLLDDCFLQAGGEIDATSGKITGKMAHT